MCVYCRDAISAAVSKWHVHVVDDDQTKVGVGMSTVSGGKVLSVGVCNWLTTEHDDVVGRWLKNGVNN